MNRHPNWKLIELFIYVVIVVVSIVILITSNWGGNDSANPNDFGGESHVIVSGE